jgi:hypothetical protein
MRRQIACINLVIAANSTLDCLTHVQAEAQPHPVVGDSLVQASVLIVLDHLRRLCQSRDDEAEADETHVGKLRVLDAFFGPHVTLLVLISVFAPQLPDEKESIADVFVCLAVELINNAVHDLADVVDEEHDTFLEDFSCIGEIANVAKTKDADHLFTRKHRVD